MRRVPSRTNQIAIRENKHIPSAYHPALRPPPSSKIPNIYFPTSHSAPTFISNEPIRDIVSTRQPHLVHNQLE